MGSIQYWPLKESFIIHLFITIILFNITNAPFILCYLLTKIDDNSRQQIGYLTKLKSFNFLVWPLLLDISKQKDLRVILFLNKGRHKKLNYVLVADSSVNEGGGVWFRNLTCSSSTPQPLRKAATKFSWSNIQLGSNRD